MNRGYTATVVEYYDEPNNRGRLDFSRNGGRTDTLIYTFADNQWFYINGSACTAYQVSNTSRIRAFPVSFDRAGNAHIRGVADILRFGRQYNETYLGQANVRGITADHWKSCMTTRVGGNMSLDWYFAAANWTTTSNGTPVRLVVEGVDPTINMTSHQIVGSHYFKHSYEFVFFTPGQADNEMFQIPHGVFCDGSQVAKTLPPVPDEFYTKIQAIDALNNTVQEFSEVFDVTNKQFWFQSSTTTFIQDFRIGVGFNILNGNCSTISLDPQLLKQYPQLGDLAKLTPDKAHLQLASAKTLFGLSGRFNVSYIGTRTVNDIPCDVYIEERVDYPQPGNITIIEQAFARKSFSFINSSNIPEHQVPVRFEAYSKNLVGRILDPPSKDSFHGVYNFYDFQFSPHHFHVNAMGWLTRKCYDSDRNVWFKLEGDVDKMPSSNMNPFIASCTDAVTKATGVDRSRIGGLVVVPVDNNIVVHGLLLGFIQNTSIKPYISMGPALDVAIANLITTVNNGQFKFFVTINGIQAQYSGIKGSVTTDVQSTCSSASSKYSAGEMAGLAIAMLLVGVIIGAVVLFVVMKRRGSVEVPYDKQNNST